MYVPFLLNPPHTSLCTPPLEVPTEHWLRGPCLPGSRQVCLRAGRAGGLQISVPTREGEPHSMPGD